MATRTITFLPQVFQTDANRKFLNATLDQLVTNPKFKKLNGFIGRKTSPAFKATDNYLPELTTQKQNYQLEPSVVIDSVFFGKRVEQPCWMNVVIPNFNATINLTYKEINATQKIDKLLEDAHKLSYKHTRKADYIDEVKIENPNGVGGLLYDVGGDAASNVQFFLTDTTHHFIRGALYFSNEPNTDSMAPVVSFVKEDLKQMLRTFKWK